MINFVAKMTLTIFFLLCICEVLLRPVKPKSTNSEELSKYTDVQMKTFSIEESNHVDDSQSHRAHVQKKYGLFFNPDNNEINNDMSNIGTNNEPYNTDAIEDPCGALVIIEKLEITKPHKRTENKEFLLNKVTSANSGELKTVEKKFFSAFSRLKSFADMYKELQQRGRNYRVDIFRDNDSQLSSGRSPGAPLRWG